ncbi:hypothetical protein [Aeromonas caviae]
MRVKLNYWRLDDWAPSKDDIGFIYQITNNRLGLKYIGCKRFWSVKTVDDKKKKVESDWRHYKGSSNETKTWDVSDCTFEMLQICHSLYELSYEEIRYLIENKALLRTDYVNWNMGSQTIGRVPNYMAISVTNVTNTLDEWC